MTHPIKINGKTYRIKPIVDLTAGEFIAMTEIEGIATDKGFDFVKYIAWQTGLKFDQAFFAVTSRSVELAIGQFPDITKMPTPLLPYVSYDKKIETVGQRHQIEESNIKGYPLLVFVLAVAQAQSMNIDEVYKLRDEYLQKPAIEILPAGFFFFRIYRNGKSKGLIFSTWLLELIRTMLLRKRPEFIA